MWFHISWYVSRYQCLFKFLAWTGCKVYCMLLYCKTSSKQPLQSNLSILRPIEQIFPYTSLHFCKLSKSGDAVLHAEQADSWPPWGSRDYPAGNRVKDSQLMHGTVVTSFLLGFPQHWQLNDGRLFELECKDPNTNKSSQRRGTMAPR